MTRRRPNAHEQLPRRAKDEERWVDNEWRVDDEWRVYNEWGLINEGWLHCTSMTYFFLFFSTNFKYEK